MRKILLTVFMIFTLCAPMFAKDIVQTKTGQYEGKVISFSDGFVKIRTNGVEQGFVRVRKNNYFGDYIKYREYPVGSKYIETNCKVMFIDLFRVVFETPEGRVSIPKYRTGLLILNFN